MRILVLANDGEGLYKFRKEVFIELLKNHEVYASLPVDKYKEKIEDLGIKFIETEFNRKGTNPISDLKQLGIYKKMLKEVRPDVVFTYTIKPNVYGGMACQSLNIPYVINVTGGLGSCENDNKLLEKLALFLYRIGARKAYRVFFQNTANRDFMIKNKAIKAECGDLIPGSGVNLKDYELLPYHDGETVDFAYIGRIMEKKGFNQYIEAAKAVKARHPEAVFHVAGIYEDDYKDVVENLVSKGIIVYHGSVVDMVNVIYRNIECVIHPTYYAEGMSNVLLEASACGRAVITTNRPGSREIVDDGVNGYLVREKDSNDLIEKVEKYLSESKDERIKMGLSGRKKVEKDFDRQIVVNKYLDIVNSLKR